MIASIRGSLVEREPNGEILIEVAGTGLGYRVVMAGRHAQALGDVGDDVKVMTYHHIREDTQVLYGFRDNEGRRCFEALISAHGVGPALALAILTVHEPSDLAEIVANEDVDGLCLVPGVGKKTAARLLIELRSKLEAIDAAPSARTTPGQPRDDRFGDLHAALENLGYRGDEIADALRDDTVRSSDDIATALRAALRHLGSRP